MAPHTHCRGVGGELTTQIHIMPQFALKLWGLAEMTSWKLLDSLRQLRFWFSLPEYSWRLCSLPGSSCHQARIVAPWCAWHHYQTCKHMASQWTVEQWQLKSLPCSTQIWQNLGIQNRGWLGWGAEQRAGLVVLSFDCCSYNMTTLVLIAAKQPDITHFVLKKKKKKECTLCTHVLQAQILKWSGPNILLEWGQAFWQSRCRILIIQVWQRKNELVLKLTKGMWCPAKLPNRAAPEITPIPLDYCCSLYHQNSSPPWVRRTEQLKRKKRSPLPPIPAWEQFPKQSSNNSVGEVNTLSAIDSLDAEGVGSTSGCGDALSDQEGPTNPVLQLDGCLLSGHLAHEPTAATDISDNLVISKCQASTRTWSSVTRCFIGRNSNRLMDWLMSWELAHLVSWGRLLTPQYHERNPSTIRRCFSSMFMWSYSFSWVFSKCPSQHGLLFTRTQT